MRNIAISVICVVGFISAANAETPSPALYGRLTSNQTRIVFAYAGDLWSVDRAGGTAKRLTTNPAEESFPVFSPDGSRLAFSRQVGGNWDVYVMPADGGEEKRVTFHPQSDYAMTWTPDGKSIVFWSNRGPVGQLYRIEPGAQLETEIPLPKAFNASL
ncbi:MAG TPA: DPP IV N-terminal domain-containing protein, partial [Blastocatellia bacterium]|nr:DPP IV N-terminal domain-containing protein [Blastocatellia bacterium]